MDYAGGDIKRQFELDATRKEWNVELIKQYEAKTAENPEDYEAQCNLAWCYVQNEEYDKAVKMVPSLGVNYPNEAKYLYQVFGIYASAKMVDECREVLGKIYALAESISDDRTEEIEYLERKLPTLALQEISLNIILERDSEAIAAAEEAMAKFPENEEVASQVTRLYLYFRCFEKAAETAMRIIQLQPDAAHGYFLLAVATFNMHRDSDAFNAINQAIDLDGTDLSAYFLKLRLLARNNAVEPAEELIDFLEQNGIEDDITIKWCRYQLDEFKELPAEEMFERVKAIIEEAEKEAEQDENNKVEWLSEAYYRMAVKLASIKDAKQDYDRKDLIEILDKGIAADPKEFDCHEYKAWLLKIDEKYDQALEIYKELEVRPRTNLYIESQLAEVYYESSYTDADKSLHYYRMVEEDEGDSRLYNLNVSYLELISGDFSGAEKHLDKAQEIVPDDAWVYFRYAQLYLVENRLDKALGAALKSIELIKQLPQDRWRALYWDQLGQVYLRMGRVEDAIQTYKECKEVCSSYDRYMKDIFEALEYNGRWEELEKHIEVWMKSEPADNWADSVAHYYLVSSQFDKLTKFMRKNKKHISSSQYGMISAKLTALKGEFDENELFREKSLKSAIKSGREHYTYNYSKLAMAYWLNDKPEMAKDAARRTIEEFGKYQKLFDLYAPIQHGCVSIAYAILGDYDKAWAALEDMKNAPFCDSCKYSVCKDVFIYKAEIETIAADIEAAKESMDTLYEADPSEESLILLEAYLIKKGLM